MPGLVLGRLWSAPLLHRQGKPQTEPSSSEREKCGVKFELGRTRARLGVWQQVGELRCLPAVCCWGVGCFSNPVLCLWLACYSETFLNRV